MLCGAVVQGYAPLLKDWDDFFTRRLFHRVQDCWNRPIQGPPRAGCTRVLTRSTVNNNQTLECVAWRLPWSCPGRLLRR